MIARNFSFENLKELSIFNNECEEVEIKEAGTIDRADNVVVVAYLIGVADDIMNNRYQAYYGDIINRLRLDKNATIIRNLSMLRTALYKNFLNIDNEIRYNLSNLDRMTYIDKKVVDTLSKLGINVIQSNCRADKYSEKICELIDKNIDSCRNLFPEYIKFEYIRSLFVPNYKKSGALKAEYDLYKMNINLYPFQVYIHWKPEDKGNILYSDGKFFTVLYEQHNEKYLESDTFKDVTDETKNYIYNFIREGHSTVMVVDCENADPYKLYGVLKNLNAEEISAIKKIILYDDSNTSVAWDYISKLVNIPIEHVEVKRVVEHKSLVDIELVLGVSKLFYKDNIDSFILCSSDSDFWGLISQIPEAKFLVLYEHEKCGSAIKNALTSKDIFHCAMNDFYMKNTKELQKLVFNKILEKHLPEILGEDAWELTKKIYAEAYIHATESEMRLCYNNIIKNIKLLIDENGRFKISLGNY